MIDLICSLIFLILCGHLTSVVGLLRLNRNALVIGIPCDILQGIGTAWVIYSYIPSQADEIILIYAVFWVIGFFVVMLAPVMSMYR